MKTTDVTLTIEPTKRDSEFVVRAICGGEVLHSDRIYLDKASARCKFAKDLNRQYQETDAVVIEAQLQDLLNSLSAQKTAGAGEKEVDLSGIVRPELFHTPEVSGLAVPYTVMEDGKLIGKWKLFMRWRHGRKEDVRECIELPTTLELPGGRTLHIHPPPPPPSLTQPPQWSKKSQAEWLAGSYTLKPAALFQRIAGQIAKYLHFSQDEAAGTTATLVQFIVLSYVYPAWSAVPYLHITGTLGSGKTRLFEVLRELVFRPTMSSNLTASALFRTLHSFGGTLLMDEAERLKDGTSDAGDRNSILLCGYKKLGGVSRSEKNAQDGFNTLHFDVYGPKSVACITTLPSALASRCIPITMIRAPGDSPKPKLQMSKDKDVWQGIRDDLHALALEYGGTWLDLVDRDDICPGINGRNYELWQPLLALASQFEAWGAEGLLKSMQDHAAKVVANAKDEQMPETDEVLLQVLAEKVLAGVEPTPTEVLNAARAREEEAFFSLRTPKGVSAVLKRYGLKTTHSGDRRYRGITQKKLLSIQQSYGVNLGVPEPVEDPIVEPGDGPQAPSVASIASKSAS